jgi:thiol-disulfide isomerase/thioredoxin
MDVSLPDRPLRRLVWGAFEGAVLGAALYVPAVLARVARPSWGEALPFLVVGAAVCAAGQYLARGILGGCLGLVGGALVGSMLVGGPPRPPPPETLSKEVAVSGVTLSGRPLDVKDLRGKVVLVDFWATWCPPCRAEMPRLKRFFDQYHAAGLEIVGVSLDSKREDLADFVRRQSIPWPQLFFEDPAEQGWHNPLVARYDIHAIPHTLLVDQAGGIVADGLRGAALEAAVEKVMAGEKPPEPPWPDLGDRLTHLLAAAGWLGGMLVERRLRQLARVGHPEARP